MTTFASGALAIGQVPVVHVDRTRWEDWARQHPFLVSFRTVDRLVIGEIGYVNHILAVEGILASLRRESRALLAEFEERVGASLGGWDR